MHESLVQKHAALAARAEAAQTVRDVNRVMQSFDTQRLNGALAGIEQQVWGWEAEAKASRAVSQLFTGSSGREQDRKLQADIMEELVKLKEERKQA
ncbi:hypothetical protein D3C73_1339230 [compost metagenome]